jgi:biotin operon repressor
LAVHVPEVLLDGEGRPLLCACVTNSDRCPVTDLARAGIRQQIRTHLQAAYPYYQRSIEAAAGRRKKSAKDVVFRFLGSAPVSKEMANEALRILAAVDPSLRDIRAGERRMAARAALMASGTQVIFSNVQLAILAALKGRARSLEDLAADVQMSRRTVEDAVRELTNMGLVKHKPGRGYYSTKEPPPDLDILAS